MTIEINEDEIRDIIADYYGATTNDVVVYTKEELRGYGMGEHTEHVVVATIKGNSHVPLYGEYLDNLALMYDIVRGKDETDFALRRRITDVIDYKEYNRWFSCDERVPEPYEVVLAAAKMDEEEKLIVYMASHTLNGGWDLIGVENSDKYHVAKWRPIPQIN